MDANCPAAGRTQRLCPRGEHRADHPFPLLAADRHHRLERDEPDCSADLIWLLFWAGWATVLISTFLINHFELFGLQQAWFHVRGTRAAKPELRHPMFYCMGRATRFTSASSSPSGRRRK